MARRKSDRAPRRTRQHVIAAQSHNFLEKFFIDKGHSVDRPIDYGTDVIVHTFDDDGYAEPGDIRIQLRASDAWMMARGGSRIAIRISTQHYHLWRRQPMPVFLVLYDAQSRRGYWLHLQDYFRAHAFREGLKSMTVHVPLRNRLSSKSVEVMRKIKARALEHGKGGVQHGT